MTGGALPMAVRNWVGRPPLTGLLARMRHNPLIVLAYHDIGAPGDVASWLRVPLGLFEEQLSVLQRLGRFVAPGEAWGSERSGGVRFLLTFDDGFANCFRLALPVLERRKVPGLFFISTWHLESGEPFWFDRIVYPIQKSRLREIDLRDTGLQQYCLPETDEAARWDVIQQILEAVKKTGPDIEEKVVRSLHRQAGGNSFERQVRRLYRPLNQKEIRRMHHGGFCRFGSHAHRHQILTRLNDCELAKSLGESKRILEARLEEAVESIAYPNGDADLRVTAACRRAGFRYGYLMRPGVVTPRTDPMAACRIGVGGYDSPSMLLFKINRALLNKERQRGGEMK